MSYDENGNYNSSQDKIARFATQLTINYFTGKLIKLLVEVGGRTPATAAAAGMFSLTRGATDGIVSSNEGTGATLGGVAAGLATGVAAYVGAGAITAAAIGVGVDQIVRAGYDTYTAMSDGATFSEAVNQAVDKRADFLEGIWDDISEKVRAAIGSDAEAAELPGPGDNNPPTESPTNAPGEPVPSDPPTEGPTEPVPTEPPTEPVPTEPPTEPVPTEPPTEPLPTEPPTEPVPTEPPTEPAPTAPPTGWPPAPPPRPRDPLVLDLDGDGVELISLESADAHFDYQADGFAEKTGWLNSDDAFLVHDDNDNQRVDGIGEIFGSLTEDGFTALAAFDTNGDGKVDRFDENFSNLKLWRDLNGNGSFEEGEMFSLSDYGIASINVTAQTSTKISSGNQVAFEGVYTRLDGTTGEAQAVLFNTNPAISRWNMPDGFEASDEAKALPNLRGYGLLPDLVYSMTLNNELREAVKAYVLSSATLPAHELRTEFQEMLFSWAGVNQTLHNSHGNYIDGKLVAFLEKYFGSQLSDNADGSVSPRYAEVIRSSFDTVVDVLLTRFLSQSMLSALALGADPQAVLSSPSFPLSLLGYDADNERFTANPDAVVNWIVEFAPSDGGDKFDYYARAATALAGLKYEYFANDTAKFKAYFLNKLSTSEGEQRGLLAFIGSMIDAGKLTGGASGADILQGTSKNDVIAGALGDDVINGGQGDDTYVYVRGDGNDTITEGSWNGNDDKLVFVDVKPTDVTLVRNDNDLLIAIAESAPGAGDAGSVLIKSTLDDYYGRGIEQVVFADGTTWSKSQIRVMLLARASTDGNDTIVGFDVADVINGGLGNDIITGDYGNDTINGGKGDDVIDGGADNDTYVYARGDGNDIITEARSYSNGVDKLVFTDINPADVALVRNGTDLTIVISETAPRAGDGSSILIKSTLDDDYGRGIEQVVFADGTTWSKSQIRVMLLAQASTDGNDTIVGFDVADVINGGLGNDIITTDYGNDTITGGKGDDVIDGGADNDTYVYARGDGNDIITEARSYSNGVDKLVFTDINPADVALVRNGTDLTIVISETAPRAGDGSSILIKSTLDDDYGRGIEQVVFADGTTWSKSQIRVMLLAQASTDGNDTIVGFDVADVINGGLGNDIITTDYGNDTITGGKGDDVIDGGADNDTYVYARGDGNDIITEARSYSNGVDKLVFTDINPADVALVRNGTDLTIVISETAPRAGDGSSILIKSTLDDDYGRGIEQVVFADGTTWSKSQIRVMLLAQASTDGNDTIVGFDVADVINGGLGNDIITTDYGNDTITGGKGDDVIDGGADNDTYVYARGDGNDTITEARSYSNGVDKLVFTDINPADVALVRNGTDLTIVISETAPRAGDGSSILIKSTLDDDYGRGIEQVVFADGTTWSKSQIRVMLLAQASTDGNDTIVGFDVADVINGGLGNDIITTDYGNDTITGGKGDDVIDGGADNDTYVYARGDGNDTITEATWNGASDKLTFTDINAADVSVSFTGTDLRLTIAESAAGAGDGGSILIKSTLGTSYGQGVEQIVFADGTTWNAAQMRERAIASAQTSGNDAITGFSSDDTYTGGKGNDVINGGEGNDTYVYARGDGNDIITDDRWNGTSDKIVFTDIKPSDVTLARSGNDLTLSFAESNPGAGDGGSILIKSTLDGAYGEGIEKIVFADGTVWTRSTYVSLLLSQSGTDGNDTIKGTANADIIAGAKGNDVINGGEGDDTYVYARGDGNDIITDDRWNGTSDKLTFTDINPSDVSVSFTGTDLRVTIAESAAGAGDGGSILIKSTLGTSYGQGVEQIVFADGTTWNAAQMRERAIASAQTSGNDAITGFSSDDTYTGGKGNDVINGGEGNDTYVYARGDGNDIITDDRWNGTSDKLTFTDINPSDVSVSFTGTDLRVTIAESAAGAGDGGSILIKSTLGTLYGEGVEQIVFADGTTWNAAQMREKAIASAQTSGNDTISGFSSDDTYSGGKGNDVINGGEGNDTYVYSRGDGNDIITDDRWNGTSDKLTFTDINPSDVSVSFTGTDLRVTIAESAAGAGDGGSILIKSTLGTSYGQGVEQIVFADGTTWNAAQMREQAIASAQTSGNDTITGFSSDDTYTGGKGNDLINGGEGNDTYVYARGDGNDIITDDRWNGTSDKLTFTDINAADVSVSFTGTDLLLTIAESAAGAGDGGSILIKSTLGTLYGEGVEQIVFADGTTWNAAQMREKAIASAQTIGNDTISGFSSDDTYSGGKGNDVINGGEGNDTYVYARGDGNDIITEGSWNGTSDKLVFTDIHASDVTLTRNGNDLTIIIADSTTGAGDGGSIAMKDTLDTSYNQGVEGIVFADGTVWTRADMLARVAYIAGTDGNDTITGTTGADSQIMAGKGDDVLRGLAGSDTYIYSSGDGNDYIDDQSGSTSEIDVLKLTDLNVGDLTFSRVGSHAKITINSTGHVITLDEQFYSNTENWGIEKIEFADGTVWDRAQIKEASIPWIIGTAGNDTLSGTSLNDFFSGGLGDDRFNSGAGSDTYIYASGDGSDYIDDESGSTSDVDVLKLTDLNVGDLTFSRVGSHAKITINSTGHVITLDEQFYSDTSNWGIEKIEFADGTVWDRVQIKEASISRINGTTGNDTLSGTSLNDVFNGGLGDDRFNSGAGSDTYIYASGDGSDYIDDESGSTSDVDVLKLTDLNVDDLTFSRVGSHAKITINSTGHVITLDEQFYSDTSNWGIEKIEFADGTVWDRVQIKEASISRINGTTDNDTLSGTSLNDVFNGGLGDDRFNSGAGSDTYIYASGDGSDYIDDESGSTSDVDVLKLTDLNVGDLTFSRAGAHAKITVNSTGHVITLDEQFYSDTSNWGIEKIEFADGTVWDRAQIKSAAVSRINGTTGNDTLSGTSLNDVFNGGLGDDRFDSGAGSDTYFYEKGDGSDRIVENSGSNTDVDTLRLVDLNASDVEFSRSSDTLLIKVLETGHQITVDWQFYSDSESWGIEKIEFADGTVWDRAQIKSAAVSRINGTTGNDTLSGTSLNDVFNGGLGDDRFDSGAGSDTYVYEKGDGSDRIVENSGSNTDVDTLRLIDLNANDVEFSRSSDTLLIKVLETGQQITVDWQFYSDSESWGIEKIEFADGTAWDRAHIKSAAVTRINGTSGDDTLSGTSLNDVVSGGLGNDTITTGAGDDVIVFKPNFGLDTVTDFQAGAGSADVLEFDASLFADFEAVLAAAAQVGNDTVITYDASNTVTLKNVALTSLHDDDVRFVA